MNLITDNKLHVFSKTSGGDFLLEIIDGSVHPKPYEILDDHLYVDILKGSSLPEEVYSVKVHPLIEFKQNFVNIVYKTTKGTKNLDTLMQTGRGIIHGLTSLNKDFLYGEFDYIFGNAELFRPSIVDRKMIEELGIVPEYVSDYKRFMKDNFFRWNRSEFNRSHFKETDYDIDGLGDKLIQELEGEVFKHFGHFTVNEWLDPYINLFFDKETGISQTHIDALIDASPTEAHFFRIIDEYFPKLKIQEKCSTNLKNVSCRNLYRELEFGLSLAK